MEKIILLYITNPNQTAAEKIADHLLSKKLIACANMFPVTSKYLSQDTVVTDNEWVLIVKTTEDRFDDTKKEVEAIHPYSTPCILKLPVFANPLYAQWMVNEFSS